MTPPLASRRTRGARLRALLLVSLSIGTTHAATAQDARVVTEPHVPPTCATLRAALVPVADSTLADTDEHRLDTQRIQHAIDACAPGHAVVLAAGIAADTARRAFLTGPLTLRPGVTLVIGEHAILFASRDPDVYALSPGSCGVVDKRGHGCRALISATRATGAGIMGPGTIDGRGWATLLGRDASWWGLAEQARASYALSQNCPRLVQISRSNDFTLYDVTLRNSPNFHVVYQGGSGFTAWGVLINTPAHARNTDGIDPSNATNVTITHSSISTGDDNVAIKAGDAGPSSHITISHDHFYAGHGMSIGSETNGGVDAVRVEDLTVDGADNALRIKSNSARGGLVHDVEYRDVCIRRTKNPIFMDTHYSASAKTEGTLIPIFRDIAFHDVHILDRGTITLDGYDAARPLEIRMDGVIADHPDSMQVKAHHLVLAQGPGPMTLPIRGEDVRVTGTTSAAPPLDCTSRFAALPHSRDASTPDVVAPYAAIVDARFADADGARVGGIPSYHTLGAALAAIPLNGVGRAVIFVRNGRYHEKLTVDRPFLTLRGESRDGTILTYDAAAGLPAPGGGRYGTRGSYTMRVVAPDFRAEHLTIENAFDYPANAARGADDPGKVHDAQGVALMLDMASDRATFDDVRISGYQDTLFPNAGRADFHDCEILGNVDFIFGAGRAVFDHCTIVSRDRGSPSNNGYVAAPSTPASQSYGFLFWHSRLVKEDPGMAPHSVVLGRPWHPFANPGISPSVVYVDCWMDDHISAAGWDRMSSVDSTGTRIWYLPGDARFFEYGSTGPGAIASSSRRVLTAAQAARYTPAAVLDGWVPTVSVSR